MRKEESTYYEHLEDAFRRWKKLPERERQDIWHYECAKAFAREQEKHQATCRKLEQAEQELQQLRTRLEQFKHLPSAPDASPYQPATIPLSREAVSHLPDSTKWDYNTLVSKWRNRLRSARSTQLSLPGTNGDHTSPTPQAVELNGYRTRSILQHRASWPSQEDGMDAQGDDEEALVDAPGEEDTDQGCSLGEPSLHRRGVLNPNLRGGTFSPH